MSSLERAIAIASTAHAGQVDKAGAPYVLHPLRVMLAQKAEPARIVAELHDVVEDKPLSFDELRREGFSDEILVALVGIMASPFETLWLLDGAAAAGFNVGAFQLCRQYLDLLTTLVRAWLAERARLTA